MANNINWGGVLNVPVASHCLPKPAVLSSMPPDPWHNPSGAAVPI